MITDEGLKYLQGLYNILIQYIKGIKHLNI